MICLKRHNSSLIHAINLTKNIYFELYFSTPKASHARNTSARRKYVFIALIDTVSGDDLQTERAK